MPLGFRGMQVAETKQGSYVLYMTSPDSFQLLRLFQKVAPAWFFRELCQEGGYSFRQGVYSAMVVVWLMIWQRLQGHRSLAAAVQYLLQGGARDLNSDCKRWAEDNVSAATGSYCQARQKLPKLIVSKVTDRMIEQLRAEVQEGWEGLNRPVFVIDGSTLQMQHEPELVEAFSPGHNQHGENHWPVMRIVVLHDVFSGLALRPSWGSMYGDAAVSEQALAAQALERLPADAVALGDGNFGIFDFAYAVQQSQRKMILRLTQARAQKILGSELLEGTDQKVVWRASRWDREAHPQLPEEASVEGRLMVCANPSRPNELLYLFTTLDLPVEEILGIYKLRWRVETDLRSIKRTIGLHQLSSKSLDMVEKELLLAMASYNLVRAVMYLAAQRANLAPRQLSFSFVQTVVEAALPGLDQATSEAEYQQRLDRMLRYAAQGKLPRRSRVRSYPREVWGRGGHFPTRKRIMANGGATT
jgi:putative transposase